MALGKGLSALIPKKASKPRSFGSEGDDLDLKFSKGRGKLSEFDEKDFVSPKSGGESIFYVEIEKIKPNPLQPRKDFAGDVLNELADSIKEFGIIQPLVVSKIEKTTETGRQVEYQLIAGERRLRAAEIVGIDQIPVVIRKASDEQKLEIALIENIQRHDLNPMEKANAFKELIDNFNLSHKDVAEKVSKSREAVSNILRLLALPIEMQKAISEGKISEGHARAIVSLENSEKQRALFQEILDKKLTVRQAEKMAKSVKDPGHKAKIRNVDPEEKELESRLQEALGTKVSFSKRGNSGKIVIEFFGSDELDKFLARVLD